MIKTPLIERINRCYGYRPNVEEIVLHPDDRSEYNRLYSSGKVTQPARFLSPSPSYAKSRTNSNTENVLLKEVPGEHTVSGSSITWKI